MGRQSRGIQFHAVEETVQPAPGHFCAVLQLQTARRRVAGVDERLPPFGHHTGVEGLEGRKRQYDLAPNFHRFRRCGGQRQRQGPNGADVGGDVLSRRAVTPGQGPHQRPVLVLQRDGHPIVLELTGEPAGTGRLPLDAVRPLFHFPCVVAVGQRQHGAAVCHFFELVRQSAPHPARGAVRIGHFGMGGFEELQLAQKGVEFAVRNGRCRQDIVPVVVLVEDPSEFLDACFGLHGGVSRVQCRHRRTARSAP